MTLDNFLKNLFSNITNEKETEEIICFVKSKIKNYEDIKVQVDVVAVDYKIFDNIKFDVYSDDDTLFISCTI